jgi:hypothetical protein
MNIVVPQQFPYYVLNCEYSVADYFCHHFDRCHATVARALSVKFLQAGIDPGMAEREFFSHQ